MKSRKERSDKRPDPTPEEIREKCEEFQRSWSPAWRLHHLTAYTDNEVEIPTYPDPESSDAQQVT